MVEIVLIEKTGELKNSKYNPEKDELYKKCKFKKEEDFVKRHTWEDKKKIFPFKFVSIFARDCGKANTENKYDLPPPVDSVLYFGTCALVAYDDNEELVNLTIELWNSFYEKLFGGFEDLSKTAEEDENEIDELESIPSHLKTKEGYLKDGFVVENKIDSPNNESDTECEWSDNMSELEYEEYEYSDDES
jgi:hypothetical protein